jgi:GMP synthase-like glutamine amidotransferase
VTAPSSALYGEAGTEKRQTVWMSHGDEVVRLPEGFEVVARGVQGAVAAIENREKRFYGFQYHPEVGTIMITDEIFEVKLQICILCSWLFKRKAFPPKYNKGVGHVLWEIVWSILFDWYKFWIRIIVRLLLHLLTMLRSFRYSIESLCS